MDNFLPQSAKILLGILAAAFLLGVVVVALLYINDVVDTVNRDREAARFQREYASLRRYHGENIAYTEVLNAIYIKSSRNLPVLVVPNGFWVTNNPINGTALPNNRLLRFPLPANPLGPLPETPPAGVQWMWTGMPLIPADDQSQYRAISMWLANISRPNSGLVFTGSVLRNDSGVPYAIVFRYTP